MRKTLRRGHAYPGLYVYDKEEDKWGTVVRVYDDVYGKETILIKADNGAQWLAHPASLQTTGREDVA